jgi:hypothetical protein
MLLLVLTEENSDLVIEPAMLEVALKKRWKQIKVNYFPHTIVGILWWEISEADDLVYGFLHSDKQIISVEGSNKDIAPFLLWYRSLVPLQYPLYVCHGESEEEIELQATDTEEGLVKKLYTL